MGVKMMDENIKNVEAYCEKVTKLTQSQAGWPATLVAACVLVAADRIVDSLDGIHDRLVDIRDQL